MILPAQTTFWQNSAQMLDCRNFRSTNNFFANIPFSPCVFIAFVLAMEFALGSCADPSQAVAKRRRRSGNHQTLMNADNDVLVKLDAAEDAKPGPATIRIMTKSLIHQMEVSRSMAFLVLVYEFSIYDVAEWCCRDVAIACGTFVASSM